MGMRQNKYQIVPSWDETVMEHNMDKTMMGHNMHKAKMGNNMDKTQMGHNMDNTKMGAPMVQAMLGHNNMDKNTRFNIFGFPMMGHGMYTNMVSRDMSTNANLMGHDLDRMAPLNMMSHKMQIETM